MKEQVASVDLERTDKKVETPNFLQPEAAGCAWRGYESWLLPPLHQQRTSRNQSSMRVLLHPPQAVIQLLHQPPLVQSSTKWHYIIQSPSL